MTEPTLCTLYHVTPASNVPTILEQGLRPTVGPRSRAQGDALPGIYAFASLLDLDGAQWLADAFDEDEPLAVLELRVDETIARHPGAGFEVILAAPVPAHALRVLCHDLDDPAAYAQLLRGVWARDTGDEAPATPVAGDVEQRKRPAP